MVTRQCDWMMTDILRRLIPLWFCEEALYLTRADIICIVQFVVELEIKIVTDGHSVGEAIGLSD